MIGERVVLLEELEFNDILYKKGHQFKVIGEDNIRGFDLEDDNGNRIYETRFIRSKYEFIKRIRDKKIKDLGI